MALLAPNQSTWNKKTVLFVHGIGLQPARYSEPLYQILRGEDPALVDATRWHEVAYDSVSQAMQAKVIQLQGILNRVQGEPALSATAGDFLVDLVNYLCIEDPYHWINTIYKRELVGIVEYAQQQGVTTGEHELYILSHSLGTVVSYEALHSIVDDAQVLGASSNFRVKAFFTLGSPLAFIKANQGRIPSFNQKFFLRSKPIARPTRENRLTRKTQTNVMDWFNLRQRKDPVASLVPLTQASSNNSLSRETLDFDAFHVGFNPHAFDNYITEYRSFILETLRG